MATITATDARNKFGQVLAQAQHEPVHVQKNGRDIAVILSAREYQRLLENSRRATLDALITEHMDRWKAVHETLARDGH